VTDLTTEQLQSLLAKLDEMIRQAQDLSVQLRSRMDNRRSIDQLANDWSHRHTRPELPPMTMRRSEASHPRKQKPTKRG
jgi:hypothetical protein